MTLRPIKADSAEAYGNRGPLAGPLVASLNSLSVSPRDADDHADVALAWRACRLRLLVHPVST